MVPVAPVRTTSSTANSGGGGLSDGLTKPMSGHRVRTSTLPRRPPGTVDVLGGRLGKVDVRTLWPLIGFVNPSLRPPPPELAVEDVVLTGATGTIQPLWDRYGPPERRRVARLLEVMGVARLVGREFGTCSDGERGRVLIARALMPAPRLLLLDEPTAGLDMAGREDLLAGLAQLAGEEPDLASVVVSHHLEDLPVTTDHALLLNGGRVLSSGPVDDVLTDHIVSRCFQIAVHIHRTGGRWTAVHPAAVASR